LNRPRWNDSFAPNNASIVNDGSEVAQNFGMVDNNDIYTFAITNGALPNGLSLNTHTGEVSGTTTDALGDYSFDITATPDAAFPEFSEQSRSFTITLVAFDHNYSFEDETMSPWTAINRQIDLGVDSIAGCQTVDTQDYSVLRDFTGGFDATDSGVVNGERAGVEDNTPVSENGYEGPPTFHSFISTSEVSDGSFAMELNSSMQPIKYGYDVVHGPAVYSNEFTANTDQVYAFDWKAVHQSDAYAVVGYLLNTSTCAQTEVIDSVGDETSWTKAAVHIPSNGTYRFVFVSGTYDKTGGRAAGAYLYLDNFQMGPPVMPHWTDEIVTDGTIGTAYTNQVVAQGFPDPVHTIVGGSLPSGLSMDAHGNITGTPTELGQFTFKVKADNGIGTIYTTVTINITDGSLPDVHWSDQTLPIPFEERVPLNDGVTAVMPGTITYSISNGSLPAGLTLNPATGAITGTPTVNGDYWFQVTATNGTDTLVASFAGIINPAPPVPMVAPANATYQWSGYNTKINWDAADQAVRYVVKWRGVTLCTTTKTSCTALGLVPNDQHVTIIAYDINGLTASGPVVFISGLTRANVTPLFANNSAKLTASYKAKLKTLALYLKAHGITNVTLIGYTDITGPKSIDSGLSIARAKAVKAYMSKFMSTKKFTIRGSGRSNPVKANTTAAGRAANRRVEIWYK
jgi:outer membrane protein OmpA-like peptidoglycan-associated protein